LYFHKMKRELEINDAKQVILNNYLAKLTKPNDAYEVLQKKVLDEKLLGLKTIKNKNENQKSKIQ